MQRSAIKPGRGGRFDRLLGRDRRGESSPLPAYGSAPDLLDLSAARIRALVDAAERAAADIGDRADAYDQEHDVDSNRMSPERRVTELARSLADRAEGLRRDAGELQEVLERASARLGGTPPSAELAAGSKGARFQPRHGEGAGPEAPEPGSSDGLRLLAIQMAVAGSSRTEIEDRLRSEFGVTEPADVLTEVLGPGQAA
jgi:hypothetical protein